MSAISLRVDDELKAKTEAIASQLGLSVSAVIAVFLKRFVAEGGFPFELKVDKPSIAALSSDEILRTINAGIADTPEVPVLPVSACFDAETPDPQARE